MEQWKGIDDFDDYEVSNYGRVRSFRGTSDGLVLKPQTTGLNYKQVRLFNSTRRNKKGHICGTLFYVHRLVCHHFIRPLGDIDHIHHLDEDKSNNHIDNLVITTQEQHCRIYHGGLSVKDVKQIREDIINDPEFGSGIRISKKWNITPITLHKIKKNETYKGIGRWKECKELVTSKLTKEEVREIREDLKTMSTKEVSKKRGISYYSIYSIKTGRTFKNVR